MVFEKVQTILVEVMGIPKEEILLESHIYDELDADSLDVSQVILALGNEYNIDFENEEIRNFKTIEDIVKFVENKIS